MKVKNVQYTVLGFEPTKWPLDQGSRLLLAVNGLFDADVTYVSKRVFGD